jgi:hypothetical protein
MKNYFSFLSGSQWFTLVLLSFYIFVFLLPKRFPSAITLIFILYGIAAGRFWDQVLGTPSIDFYDIGKSGKLDLFDIILYIAYGSPSYFMVYIFDRFKLRKQHLVFYIPVWALIAIGFEVLGNKLGVFNYKNGYKLIYSYPIYLISFSILFILYYKLYKQKGEG